MEVRAIEKVVASAKKHGKASGIHIGSVDAVRKWREKGMTVLACSTDINFQYSAAKSTLEGMKK
jgi:2-keto-3-deoxy-L-rhamnonate aldolase RhmA